MTGSVVTGIDGSDTAREAASKAAELAATRGVELVVVCAYDKLEVTELNEDGRQYVFTTEESAQTSAQAAISDFQKQYPGLAGRAVAAQGKPASVLIEVATDHDAAVIVVGNKRVQGVTRLLGSIATDVAHKAPCDVYIANTHPMHR